jgi:hypothetical protein
VNISAAMRIEIIKNVESGRITQGVFEKAEKDIEHIIEHGVWKTFVQQRQ